MGGRFFFKGRVEPVLVKQGRISRKDLDLLIGPFLEMGVDYLFRHLGEGGIQSQSDTGIFFPGHKFDFC